MARGPTDERASPGIEVGDEEGAGVGWVPWVTGECEAQLAPGIARREIGDVGFGGHVLKVDGRPEAGELEVEAVSYTHLTLPTN